MRLSLTLVLVMLAAPLPARADSHSWLCISELSAGFTYDTASRKWSSTTFQEDGEKYLIRPLTDYEVDGERLFEDIEYDRSARHYFLPRFFQNRSPPPAGGAPPVGSRDFRTKMRELASELGFNLKIQDTQFGGQEATYENLMLAEREAA